MALEPIRISMTSFGDFCASDPLGQPAKVRELRRQYEQQYALSSDFWSRWRAGVERVHAMSGSRVDLDALAKAAKDNRGEQYASASTGYGRFWGRKKIELIGRPKPVEWQCDLKGPTMRRIA